MSTYVLGSVALVIIPIAAAIAISNEPAGTAAFSHVLESQPEIAAKPSLPSMPIRTRSEMTKQSVTCDTATRSTNFL